MKKANSHPVWTGPADSLDLSSDQVDVWRARLDLPAEALEQLDGTLSKEEKDRAARFYFPADRDRFIASHGCLRDVLRRYLHCEPGQLTFTADSYGKPALGDHDLEFNLTHSGDLALVAVTRGRKVGVDVERIRAGISSFVIARQYFSKAEVAELETLPIDGRQTAFFTCWTRKEAYIKAQGLGLTLPLESFDVSLLPDEPPGLRATRPDPEEAVRWTLFSPDVDPDYRAAVCAYGQDLALRLWDWKINL